MCEDLTTGGILSTWSSPPRCRNWTEWSSDGTKSRASAQPHEHRDEAVFTPNCHADNITASDFVCAYEPMCTRRLIIKSIPDIESWWWDLTGVSFFFRICAPKLKWVSQNSWNDDYSFVFVLRDTNCSRFFEINGNHTWAQSHLRILKSLFMKLFNFEPLCSGKCSTGAIIHLR